MDNELTSTPLPGRMTGRLPDFVVIGAMRSGSTSLYRHLADHPEVWMDHKEIHFFDRRFEYGVDWYKSVFPAEAQGAKAYGEATPSYLYDREAIGRMAEVLPHARLLAILRDPVERAYSHYWMDRARGREHRPFEAVVDEELRDGFGSDSAYLDRGRYQPQLECVCRHFPREALHVVLLDDLEQAPGETFAGVCRFVGVDPSFSPPHIGERVNRFVSFRSQRLQRARKQVPKVFRARLVLNRLNAKKVEYPPMAEATRARLRDVFVEDNRALAAWMGRDLSGWSATA